MHHQTVPAVFRIQVPRTTDPPNHEIYNEIGKKNQRCSRRECNPDQPSGRESRADPSCIVYTKSRVWTIRRSLWRSHVRSNFRSSGGFGACADGRARTARQYTLAAGGALVCRIRIDRGLWYRGQLRWGARDSLLKRRRI